jgi:hypothetical protein
VPTGSNSAAAAGRGESLNKVMKPVKVQWKIVISTLAHSRHSGIKRQLALVDSRLATIP